VLRALCVKITPNNAGLGTSLSETSATGWGALPEVTCSHRPAGLWQLSTFAACNFWSRNISRYLCVILAISRVSSAVKACNRRLGASKAAMASTASGRLAGRQSFQSGWSPGGLVGHCRVHLANRVLSSTQFSLCAPPLGVGLTLCYLCRFISNPNLQKVCYKSLCCLKRCGKFNLSEQSDSGRADSRGINPGRAGITSRGSKDPRPCWFQSRGPQTVCMLRARLES